LPKEKVALKDSGTLKRGSIHMKFVMTGQANVTIWPGFTYIIVTYI
jgi:hypothetical protein